MDDVTFHPFPQRCLTCETQFRVTKPELVGQIVACPKCGSMLQIAAPDSPVQNSGNASGDPIAPMTVGNESVDSEALTQVSSMVTSQEDSFASQESPLPRSSQVFEVDETVPPPSPNPSHDPSLANPAADTGSAGFESMPIDFQSDRTTRQRQLALVVFTLISGLCVAGLLFLLFIRSWRGRDTVKDDEPKVAESSVEADDITSPMDSQQLLSESEPAETTETTQEDSAANDLASENSEAELEDAPDFSQITSTVESDSANTASPAEGPSDLMQRLFDPESSTVDGVSTPETSMGDTGDAENSVEAPAGLPQDFSEAFTPFLVDLSTTRPDAPPPLQESVMNEPVILDQAASADLDPMMVANPPEPIDFRRSMSIEFGIKASRGFAMSDLVLLVSQLTTVPIELDWVSFDLANLDVRQPLKLGTSAQSAEAHLNNAAQQIGAVMIQEETLLRLTISDEVFRQASEPVIATDDFGDGRDSADQILQAFLAGDEPESVAETPDPVAPETEENPDLEEPVVGDPQWRSQRASTQLAIVATDALRRMRGIPARVDDAVMRRWTVELDASGVPRTDLDSNGVWPLVLDGVTGDQSFEAMPMAQWIREVAQINQATCLVHWSDATRRMMSPGQLVLPHVGDGFEGMVSSTLDPFGMQIRQVSPGYWWLGTKARYDRLPVVVWTAPMKDQERNAFLQKLDATMGGLSRDFYRTSHDAISDRLLLMMPRFILPQMNKFQ